VLLNLPPFAASINPILPERLAEFLVRMVIVNFVLALFNLLPIPPLDGSKIVAILLPRDWADWVYSPQAQTVGMILVAVLVFTGYTRFLGPAVWWATEGLIRLVVF
jgi:Zn-dependent protease